MDALGSSQWRGSRRGLNALGKAGKRFGAGVVGWWCILIPPVIIVVWRDPSGWDPLIRVKLFAVISASFAFVIWFCWKQGLTFLKWLAVAMLELVAFSILGGVATEILTYFTGKKLFAGLFGIAVITTGFWVVELRQKPDGESP